jgi:hypothetical protein
MSHRLIDRGNAISRSRKDRSATWAEVSLPDLFVIDHAKQHHCPSSSRMGRNLPQVIADQVFNPMSPHSTRAHPGELNVFDNYRRADCQ